jgi:hypothetical protein
MRRDLDSPSVDHHGPRSVVAWRAARLRAAGWDAALAERVARDPSFDLHALIGLAERGCPPALAVRILAPIDPWQPPR